MSFIDDMKDVKFGTDLAASLVNIGKVLGEERRRAEADKLVGEVFQDVFTSRDPFAFMRPENASRMNRLQGTDEGREAIGTLNTGLGLGTAMSNLQMSRMKQLGYGDTLFNINPDNTSTEVARGLDKPTSSENKTITGTVPFELWKDQTTYTGPRTRVINGQARQVILEGEHDPRTGDWVRDKNGKIVTKERTDLYSKPGDGGNDPNKKVKYVPNITRVFANGDNYQTSSERAQSTGDEEILKELYAAQNSIESSARNLGSRDENWVEGIKRWFTGSAPPRDWDTLKSRMKDKGFSGVRKELGNDILIRHSDAYALNWAEIQAMRERMGLPPDLNDPTYIEKPGAKKNASSSAGAGNQSTRKPKPQSSGQSSTQSGDGREEW